MATTALNSLIIAASRKLHDARTDASSVGDTGRVYSSAMLTDYANRSVRDFLRDSLKMLGPKVFAETFPEYVKTSAALTLSSGSVAKPTDALFILGLMKSDLSLNFEPVKAEELASVLTGGAGLLNASATQPLFYDEGLYIKTLGVTTGDVYARYIRTHPDLTPITGVSGNGKFYTTTANMTYAAAIKELSFSVALSGLFTSADAGKPIMFRTAAVCYSGHIVNVTIVGADTGTVLYLAGDGLPAVDLTTIADLIVTDVGPIDSDLKLNQLWLGDIIDRMVAMGEGDAVRIIQQK